jgi:hypothetical protein
MPGNNMKFNSKKFVSKLISRYHEARKPIFEHSNIQRGRSRSISGEAEDLLAFFIAENLNRNYKYFIDQPLTTRRIKIYPDILILNRMKCHNLIDVKMDLGWNRNRFISFCNKKSKLLQKLSNQPGKFKTNHEENEFRFHFGKYVGYHIVIISNKNITENKFNFNYSKANRIKGIRVYALTGNIHPNEHGMNKKQKMKQIKINNDQFTKLLKNLRDTC